MKKLLVIGSLILSYFIGVMLAPKMDLETQLLLSSVTITNLDMDRGGSGVILRSTSMLSTVLTNAHVCKAIGQYGLVIDASGGKHVVLSNTLAEAHDLCLITVASDLHINTYLAPEGPKVGTKAYIAGHPMLLPTVISTGYFVGKTIITIVEVLPGCATPQLPFLCESTEKKFESEVVSATIQPGSSGSGIFNEKGELSALVFAGAGGFGYAMAVPLEYIHEFLGVETNFLITGK